MLKLQRKGVTMAETLSHPAIGEVLAREGVGYDVLRHPHTETALDEAKALAVRPAQVAKTLVLHGPEGYVRAVVPSVCRLDLRKVRELVPGGKAVRLATEAELARDYPEFELGAVPPLGGRQDLVLVDERLLDQPAVILEAGSHAESIKLDVRDLVSVARAAVADLCTE
jgi:Ala-tRNA(Pro) deacylase